MAAKRKLWSTLPSYAGAARRKHESRAEAYRYALNDARNFAGGSLRPGFTHTNVYVDERAGRGWQLYERLDLAELSHGPA